MTLHDRRGLAVSTSNRALLERYEQALDLTASYFVDPLATIDSALEADPTFAAGHCLRAALALMSSERGALPILEQSVTAIEALGGRANERERMHAAAGRAWLGGDFARSMRLYGDIDFFLGQSTLLRDRMAQMLPHWNEDVPGYGYVLGMHAFGLEETANYAGAEAKGRRALELNPRDPWAVHAVAHVMEMQGRLRDVDVGARWQPLADSWRPLATEGFYAFNDAHAVMALVGADRWDEVDDVLGALERAASEPGTDAMMSREIGLPVARAFAAFGRGHYEAAIDDLLQVRGHANRFGGSHAQRDIVHLTLTESALRVAGRDDASRKALENAATAVAAQRPARLETRSVAA